MHGPDDVQRLREHLARALRYAELERQAAAEWKRQAHAYERSAKRLRNAGFLFAASWLIALVWVLVWGFNR